MLGKIINIHSISVIQQSLNSNIYGLTELEFDARPIGAGGVGSLYKIINIDGKTVNGLLAKIIHNVESSVKTYETISILHDKIKNWQESSNKPLFLEYPELCGLPFMAFKGKSSISSDEITVFLTYNLNELGFEDFGADNWNKSGYSEIDFADKLMLCYQYVKAANFLHELKFIHADLKDESIFINLKRPQLAIIDFDGGYNFDKQKFALTIGAINRWASPTWLRFIGIGKYSQEVSTEDRLSEENWVMASAIFELLFSVPPFFFLKNTEVQTISNYLNKNKWPSANADLEDVNMSNLSFHNSLLDVLKGLRESGLGKFIDAFKKIFNAGLDNSSKRLKAIEWKKLLEVACKEFIASPEIVHFVSDKKGINSKDELVKFSWKMKYSTKVYLNSELQDLFSNNNLIQPKDERNIEIRAVNDFGSTTKIIHINANKVDPLINKFSSNLYKRVDHTPVTLKWITSNCKEVYIDKIDILFPKNGEYDVNPQEKTKYILTAVGFFDQQVLSELEIDIETPEIIDFRYEVNIERGIDNVDLIWQVKNATEAEINPFLGKVDTSGKSHVRINEKQEFRLTVKGIFAETSKIIEAQPFPIPIIKTLFIPTPQFNLTTKIPHDLLVVPEVLLKSFSDNFSNNITFNDAEIPFHVFQENLIIKLPEARQEDSNRIFKLFNNLFYKIFKSHQ